MIEQMWHVYKNYHEVIESFFTSLAIIVGASWALYRFILNRDGHPKIEFNLDLRIIGRQNGKILIEVIAVLENKGKVRHRIRNFVFDILTLDKDSPLISGDKSINYQVQFNKLKQENCDDSIEENRRRNWIPLDWYSTFVDPGVTQNYTYLTSIDQNVTFISIYSRFHTFWKTSFQTAQKTFSVREKELRKLEKSTFHGELTQPSHMDEPYPGK